VIAVLYDVHGNLPALEAVVADARARAAERWILGGDYALFGPEPEATVALLRGLAPATWIRGNGERWTAAPDEAPDNPILPDAIAASREAKPVTSEARQTGGRGDGCGRRRAAARSRPRAAPPRRPPAAA